MVVVVLCTLIDEMSGGLVKSTEFDQQDLHDIADQALFAVREGCVERVEEGH